MTAKPRTKPLDANAQRDALADAERRAHARQPRNFKEDAKDKQVRVEPDGTGPSTTGTLDAKEDQKRGSGNDTAQVRKRST